MATAGSLLQVLGQADFVIEAINEDETSKKAAFLLLDRASSPCLPAPQCICKLQGICSSGRPRVL